MLKKIFTFSIMFFLIVSVVLYFAGVREINSSNASTWIRAIATRFHDMDALQIPEISKWNFTLGPDPAWYEYVQYYVSYIANVLSTIVNTASGIINFFVGLFKFMVAIVWTFIESPSILLQS